MSELLSKKDQIRQEAESSLEAFIALVHPQRVLGGIHKEVLTWWTRDGAKSHQLLLLPRDHQKSALIAYRVAWALTRDPTLRILYLSSTSNLATKQLKFIKDILTCDRYRFYWPEMVNKQETTREKWTETEISVDHPKRRAEAIRDPSIFTAGLTTSITGLHCDITVLDDVVVGDNAYTEEGRERVRTQVSYIASIEGADAQQWAVGTRYHPKDLYDDFLNMEVDTYDAEGNVLPEGEKLYEIMEHQVENRGDGTGEFLWPRQQRRDGKWFGFDSRILSRKRAQYLDKTQFRAQYYNDPNDITEAPINPECFQYYEPTHLHRIQGSWYYKTSRLNVFAAVDFAYSLAKTADYTSIAVVGVDAYQNYYVLELDRFKTKRISEYFDHILRLHQKWDFRKIKAEITAAQAVIVDDLKNNYIRKHGIALTVEDHKPSRHEGHKEERIMAILEPRYTNRQIWHYRAGNCQTLEEELVLQNPPHDDLKDAVAVAVDMARSPSSLSGRRRDRSQLTDFTHNRFGGIC